MQQAPRRAFRFPRQHVAAMLVRDRQLERITVLRLRIRIAQLPVMEPEHRVGRRELHACGRTRSEPARSLGNEIREKLICAQVFLRAPPHNRTHLQKTRRRVP